MKPGGGKLWFTAADLAALSLPGLSKSKRKINERAAAELWALRTDPTGVPLARARQARGGGIEYHIDVIPTAARSALVSRGVSAIAHVASEPETTASMLWRRYEAMTDNAKAEAKRRMAAVTMIEAYERHGLTRSAAIATTAARMTVGSSTLWEWLSLISGVDRSDRLAHLAPCRKGGGVTAEIDEAAWKLLLSDYLRPEQPTFSSCYHRLLTRHARPAGITLPAERTLRRKLDREVDPLLVVSRRKGAEAARRMLPPQKRSVADLHAMECVNIDGHKWDVFVQWPDGTISRPMMVAIQDIYSRKILAWSIGRSESVVETRLALAMLFERYGVPRALLSDNGRAFASKAITGWAKHRFRFKIRDEDPQGLLDALGVEVHFALPYRGQSKPIERAFRDFCDTIAKAPEFAGAYTGNRPDAKPENYGKAAIPIERFNEVVEAGIAAHNARPKRDTEVCAGQHSFDEVFAASYAISPIGKATAEQLRLALLAADQRPTDRENGSIKLFGNRYWTPELSAIAGDRVTVRFNPDDLHAPIHVYSAEGQFVCTAPVFEAAGFLDVGDARARARLEKDHKRKARDLAEAERLLDVDDVARAYGAVVAAEIVEPSVPRLVRPRGPVAQIKPREQARTNPVEQAATIDRMAAGLRSLRSVK